ncbi:MAG: hypothetical protein ACYCV7_07730 [Acidimicrobiales bacterium]
MARQRGEQVVEPVVRNVAGSTMGQARPEQTGPVILGRVHGVAVGAGTLGAAATGQRERVDHRPGASLDVEAVEVA